MLKIKFLPHEEILEIDEFWLRDHCSCDKCYNVATKQKKYNLLDIPKDIKPDKMNYSENGKVLYIKCKFSANVLLDFIKMTCIYDLHFRD